MDKMRIQNLVLGMVATNCYFVQNKETKEMLLVDPADNAGVIERKVSAMEGNPVAILLTHGHFDHIGAAAEVRDHYRIPIYADEAERKLLEDPSMNLSAMSGGGSKSIRADHFLRDNEEFTLAGFHIRMLHTPGHTPGGCCYYFPEEKVLFSGDTLFAGSCGRTDFPLSSGRDMMQSLSRLAKEIPDDVAVYPGHDAFTTMADEKRYNPYIRQ